MTRDSAVQTIVEITINDKYTLLDDDTLIVLESEKSYIQTNFESDADSTTSDDENVLPF